MHKILLVDDTRTFLDLERSFLKRSECRILTASTGLDGVRVARAELPDLVLLDIEMPEMNGIQACRILKSDPKTQKIVIIILSSMKMEDEARRAGANHFLRKPIDESRFLEEIKRFVPIRERVEDRASVDLSVTFTTSRASGALSVGVARMRNLSRTGFLVTVDGPPEVGARTAFSFFLDGRLMTGEAMVVRTTEPPDTGFAGTFLDLSPEVRSHLEKFLLNALAGKASSGEHPGPRA